MIYLADARERGVRPICQVMGSVVANSAYHGTRLDVGHICSVMEELISRAEKQWGISRHEIAPQTVFVSHETYTPARGGSASAEVMALRNVFQGAADQIVVANTKGFTGHTLGAAGGIEAVASVLQLSRGFVHGSINCEDVHPEIKDFSDRIPRKCLEMPDLRVIAKAGFGFGDVNSCLIFRKWEA